MKTLPLIPEDAIAFVREAFADANAKTTRLLSRQPSIHEEGLDFHLIASLDEIGPRLLPGSGAAVEIETHWLGGRRHFGRWEIADIALVVVVRRAGALLARKVALLQSKRLYSRELPVSTSDRSDYVIGMGRLVDRTETTFPLSKPRTFGFTEDCVYGAIAAGGEQVQRIEKYVVQRDIPVFYALYNPARIPLAGAVPRLATALDEEEMELGCRILTASEIHAVLATLPTGRPPAFAELVNASRKHAQEDAYAAHGWRLETFVADEVLRCREGRVFESAQDLDLSALLYERSAPIAAAIVTTIDLSADAG